jgi:hypothetical protein
VPVSKWVARFAREMQRILSSACSCPRPSLPQVVGEKMFRSMADYVNLVNNCAKLYGVWEEHRISLIIMEDIY